MKKLFLLILIFTQVFITVTKTKAVSQSDCLQSWFNKYENNQCLHKDLFPQTGQEILGCFIMALLLGFATMAGIGGGGAISPILMVCFGFTLKESVPISSMAIMFGGLVRFLLNFNEKHPLKDAVSIDYGLASVMMPSVIIGTVIGAYLYIYLPAAVILIIVTLLFIGLSIQSLIKAYDTYIKENLALKNPTVQKIEDDQFKIKLEESVSVNKIEQTIEISVIGQKDQSNPDKSFQLNDKSFSPQVDHSVFSHQDQNKTINKFIVTDLHNVIDKSYLVKKQKVEEILRSEKTHFQWSKQLINILILGINITISVLRGSSSNKSIINLKKCSIQDWTIQSMYVVGCGLITILAVFIVRREQKLKKEFKIPICDGDIDFTGNSIIKLIYISIFAGIIAGAFGLGGGSIFNPALISMGVQPRVSTSTGMYLVLFSKLAACAVYLMAGVINIYYSLWIGLWCIIGSTFGIFLLEKVMSRIKRQSPIVIALAFILGLEAIIVPVFGINDIRTSISQGQYIWSFTSIC